MATKKDNIKALFVNTRSRIIILFTLALVIVMMVIGFFKLHTSAQSPIKASSGFVHGPGISSIPGALNQTAQYAALQETQNVEQAQEAQAKGTSAIPTIIRSQAFGEGVETVGAQGGSGSVGFSTLAREGMGAKSSLWYQMLQDTHCSQQSLSKAIEEGAALVDLKQVCTCLQLKEHGYDLSDLKAICPCPELKSAGFGIRAFKAAGYNAGDLKICGFVACEERAAGFSAQDMKNAGYSDGELSGAGFSEQDIARAGGLPDGVSLSDVQKAGCSVENLKRLRASGVSAAAIRRISGCSAAALREAGFTALDLKNAGFSAAELKAAGFTAEQLRQAGYSARALLDAGFTPQDLADAGFSNSDIVAAEALLPEGMNADNIQKAGCSVAALKRERLAGVSASMIKKLAHCSAADLTAAGFLMNDLLRAGFNPEELNAKPNIDGSDMTNAAMIKDAGCDPAKLKILHDKGISAKQIHDLNGCSADALRKAGYDLAELAAAGFTPAQLLAAGFTPDQLLKAGLALSPAGIVAAGRVADCSVESLKAARAMGMTAAAIKHSLGCSAAAMKLAGFTAAELRDAGYSAAELKAAGFSAADLKAAGFSAKDLRAAGFSASELKAAGFDAAALKAAGFSAEELKTAGFSAAELKAAGFTAAELKAAGYSAAELKKAGYSAAELKSAGFSAAELRAAGFTGDELQSAGFSPSDSALAGLEGIVPPKVSAAEIPSLPGSPSSNDRARRQEENAKKLAKILAQQKIQMADQKYQQKVQQRSSAMLAAANQALGIWKISPQQIYLASSVKTDAASAQGGRGALPPGSMASDVVSGTGVAASIKMGDVMFAVIDTSVDSDEPGPILATIVSGKLKGSKLIGSFNLPTNADKMVVSFNSLSIPGAPKTITISAFAIDPNTARTALSSETDHHYLSRYGALFASTFLEGFGNAFQSADTTITVGGTGGTTDTTVQNGIGRSTLENAVIGLATVGKAWGQVAQQNMSRPTTVQLFSGTGIGVLFTQDLIRQ